jgi:hypothetical protein
MADVTCPLTREDWRTLLSHETLPSTLRTIREDRARTTRLRVGVARSGSKVYAGARGEPRHTSSDSTEERGREVKKSLRQPLRPCTWR